MLIFDFLLLRRQRIRRHFDSFSGGKKQQFFSALVRAERSGGEHKAGMASLHTVQAVGGQVGGGAVAAYPVAAAARLS